MLMHNPGLTQPRLDHTVLVRDTEPPAMRPLATPASALHAGLSLLTLSHVAVPTPLAFGTQASHDDALRHRTATRSSLKRPLIRPDDSVVAESCRRSRSPICRLSLLQLRASPHPSFSSQVQLRSSHSLTCHEGLCGTEKYLARPLT